MMKNNPPQHRDARQPREVRPQPGQQQHYQGEVRQHNGPPPREVKSQPRPVQSRDIKAQRKPAGEAKGQNKHEGGQQEGQERR